MKKFLKSLLLPPGRKLRSIRFGLAKGIRMNLDLQSQSQRMLGLDERELFTPLRELMPRCRSMIDIGANDGYYTMIFLKSPAERVISVEGGPVTDKLIANAQANGHQEGERFKVINLCAGAAPDQASVAGLVGELPGPILIKLDVDGAEIDVLQSADGSPRLSELCWIIEVHSPELENGCIEWLRGHGYDVRIINPAWWRFLVPERREVEHNRWLMAVPVNFQGRTE